MPSASRLSTSASVPFATATAWQAPVAEATSSSSARMFGPRMKRPESITSQTLRLTSSRRCSYCPRMSIRGTGMAATLLAGLAPLTQYQPGPDGDRGGHDDVVEVAEAAVPLVPVRARHVADRDQHDAPGQRAENGQDGEAAERHPGDARGQRDERAHDRQKPREEH